MSKTTLDEIFDDYEMIGETFSTDPKDTKDIPYLKQAILRWVADEVIGDTRLLTNYYNQDTDDYDVDGAIDAGSWDDIFEAGSQQTINEQLKILAQHGYKGANQ